MQRRKLFTLFAAYGAIPLLTGCNKMIDWIEKQQESVFEWTEDVVLQGGQTIVVKRSARLSANDITGGGGGSFIRDMTLQIISPRQTDLPITWSDVYVPVLLDRDDKTNEWFLVATFFHCDSWYHLNRPPLPYTEYRFRQGRWQRQNLSSDLIGRQANLFIAGHKPKALHLTNESKKAEIKPGTGKKYLSIVSQWRTGC